MISYLDFYDDDIGMSTFAWEFVIARKNPYLRNWMRAMAVQIIAGIY